MTSKFLLLSLIFLGFAVALYAQDDSIAISHADTTNFTVCKETGWILYNSYVAQNTRQDSASIELILKHANNIDLQQEQYVGKIKTASLYPKEEQTIAYNQMADNYALRIDDKGNCYIRFVSGKLPDTAAFFLPVVAVYKL